VPVDKEHKMQQPKDYVEKPKQEESKIDLIFTNLSMFIAGFIFGTIISVMWSN